MPSVALVAIRRSTGAVSLADKMLFALSDRAPSWLLSDAGSAALGIGANEVTGARRLMTSVPAHGVTIGIDAPEWLRTQFMTQLEHELARASLFTPHDLGELLSAITGDCHCIAILGHHLRLAYRSPTSSRPLFYSCNDDLLLVASQIRAISAVSSHDISVHDLAPFLVPQLCDPASSALHNICRLPPGFLLTWRDGDIDVRQVSRVEPIDTSAASRQELVTAFRNKLFTAIERSSNPPDGLLLSGGIDSSALSCSYAQISHQSVRAYALTYDEKLAACDERRYVDDVESSTGIQVGRLDGNRLLPLVAGFPEGDEPEPWPYAARNWGLLRFITADTTQATATVLAGEGGDELLLGQVFSVADRLARGDTGGGAREIRTFPDAEAAEMVVRGLLSGAYDGTGARILRALSDIPSWLATGYVSDAGIVDRLAAGYPQLNSPGSIAGSYSRAVLFEMGAAGRVQCGGWYEDMGRKTGLAITCPFLDPDLAALVWAVPPHLLRDGGQEKVILREALSDVLPASVAERKDKAEALALLHAGLTEAIDTVRQLAEDGPLVDYGIIDPDRLLVAVDRYAAGDLALAPALWATVSVHRWLQDQSSYRPGGRIT